MRATRALPAMLIAVGAALAGGAVTTVPSAAAAEPRTFEAVAAADGMRTTAVSPGAPLSDTVVDLGGPSAQVLLDSVGTSTGFAAYPDPGATVRGAPATAGRSDVALPFVVTSRHPVTPTAQAGTGPYALQASSEENGSVASAQSGPSTADASGAFLLAEATASFVSRTGTIVAQSRADARNVALAALTVGRVEATARVEQGPAGALRRSSDVRISGLSAAGTSFGVGPKGLTVAGTTAPLPESSPVRDVLAQAGITLTYLEPEESETGIISGGLRVTTESASGQRTSQQFGRAAARITQTVSGDATATTAPPPPFVPAQEEVFSGAPGTSTSVPLPDGVAVDLPAGSDAAVVPDTAPVSAGEPPATQPQAFRQVAVIGWPRSFFLVLAGGSLLALAAATLLTTLGVRYP